MKFTIEVEQLDSRKWHGKLKSEMPHYFAEMSGECLKDVVADLTSHFGSWRVEVDKDDLNCLAETMAVKLCDSSKDGDGTQAFYMTPKDVAKRAYDVAQALLEEKARR